MPRLRKQNKTPVAAREVTTVTRTKGPQRAAPLVLALLASLPLAAQPEPHVEAPPFAATLRTLLDHDVPERDVDALAAARPAPVLLDAREADEYAVSRLPGARWVGYDDFDLARVADLDPDAPVVVYCSVGYRSEKVAGRLRAAGFTDVANLYGGLFEWVNRGHPIVDAEGRLTRRVHAYSRTWGVFLRRGERVYGAEP
jgi:rhodanese-related sulfurtransferase